MGQFVAYQWRVSPLPRDAGLETDHILLPDHADHDVYMHEQCATGNNAVETTVGDEGVAITCPECGGVETR